MTDLFTAPAVSPLDSSRLFFKRLLAGVVMLNLAVAGIGWFSLKSSRSHHNERAAITTQNIAKILDETLTGIVAKVDIAMLAVVDEAERQLATGAIQEAALNRFIVRAHGRIAELAVFRATDASGDAIYGPVVKAASTTSLAHRDYFKWLKETSNAGLVISKPLVGGISGKWMVILARRINQPNGTFAGLVYAGVTIDQLTKDFSTIDVGKQGSIALIDPDGTLVARYPEDPAGGKWVGRRISSRHLDALIALGSTTGTFTNRSSLDSTERTFSGRRLELPRPFLISVGLATSDYLAEWRSEAWKLSAFIGVFLILTVVSAVLIHRDWRRNGQEVVRREQAQDLLLRQKEELEATLARTKRLEGILSICMHCKKINNKQESWEQLEKYITDHSDAHFSHGICPDCIRQYFPDLNRDFNA